MTAALVTVNNAAIMNVEGFGVNLIERFAKFAGVSESSRQTYAKSLRQMFRYFAQNDIKNPTRENLVEWVEEMKLDGKSASTIQLYLTSCKLFFRWAMQENLYPNIADHLKSGVKPSQSHKRDALDVDQCRSLVASVKGSSLKNLRDRAILVLMTTAGLRTIEVVRANVGDVRFERGKVFLYVQGKGHSSKDDRVLLSKQSYQAIKTYLKARGKVQSAAPLFVSTSRRNLGARLDTQVIRKLVKVQLRSIGLDSPRLSAHSLRHAVATNLIFAGLDLPKIQMIMRHKNLSTSMIYAHNWERYQNDGEQLLSDIIFKE